MTFIPDTLECLAARPMTFLTSLGCSELRLRKPTAIVCLQFTVFVYFSDRLYIWLLSALLYTRKRGSLKKTDCNGATANEPGTAMRFDGERR